ESHHLRHRYGRQDRRYPRGQECRRYQRRRGRLHPPEEETQLTAYRKSIAVTRPRVGPGPAIYSMTTRPCPVSPHANSVWASGEPLMATFVGSSTASCTVRSCTTTWRIARGPRQATRTSWPAILAVLVGLFQDSGTITDGDELGRRSSVASW